VGKRVKYNICRIVLKVVLGHVWQWQL
jgi:hypothetical protein